MEEMKLQTPVEEGRSRISISLKDSLFVLGSCFADNMGGRMQDLGFNVCVNPFGTIYNPASICNSIDRLASGEPFTEDECVLMGSGSGMICSFSHHTSFARLTQEEFLDHANASLADASARWKAASKVIITLGTAWVYEYSSSGKVVSNCLKIDAKQFIRRRLSVSEVSSLLKGMAARFPEKEFIFTVSPIRHFRDGAHGNQISKSVLLLALEEVCEAFPERCDYFPAYEIVLDELRNYRFYAADMVHPSELTETIIWRRFLSFSGLSREREEIVSREKEHLRSLHRPNLAR